MNRSEIAKYTINEELKLPKGTGNYQYIRGLINMAYYLDYISGDERSSLIKEAEKFAE